MYFDRPVWEVENERITGICKLYSHKFIGIANVATSNCQVSKQLCNIKCVAIGFKVVCEVLQTDAELCLKPVAVRVSRLHEVRGNNFGFGMIGYGMWGSRLWSGLFGWLMPPSGPDWKGAERPTRSRCGTICIWASQRQLTGGGAARALLRSSSKSFELNSWTATPCKVARSATDGGTRTKMSVL